MYHMKNYMRKLKYSISYTIPQTAERGKKSEGRRKSEEKYMSWQMEMWGRGI